MPRLTDVEVAALKDAVERERMAVKLFRPFDQQEEFFLDDTSMFMVLSGGNRSGKSTCAALRFAAIATDTPIIFKDGRVVNCRRPHQRGKCLKMWVIGYDEKHIGQTIHRLLFKAGELFDTCYDKETGRLRAWDFDNDDENLIQKRPCPPAIPQHFIDGKIVWKNYGERVFSSVKIINPITKEPLAEIFAYGSKGDPKQGDSVDVIWIDEQLGVDGYLTELKARVISARGFLFWSSWPDMESEQLDEMIELCKKEIHKPKSERDANLYTITMRANKSLDKKTVESWLNSCASPEEAMARDQGVFLADHYRVYPHFDQFKPQFQAVLDDEALEDELSKVLRANGGEPPHNWTRELILDPGTNHPCVLLCAIPPKEFGDYRVIYKEVYPGRADPWVLAAEAKKSTGNYVFNRFIGDRRAGRQQQMGMLEGYKTFDAYSDAFAQFGLRCVRTGTSFMPACDQPGTRAMALNSWMQVNEKGFAKLRVVYQRCPKLCEQMKKARKKVIKKEVTEDRRSAGTFDVLDCAEYWAAAAPEYELPPENLATTGTSNFRWLMSKLGRTQEYSGSVTFGPNY